MYNIKAIIPGDIAAKKIQNKNLISKKLKLGRLESSKEFKEGKNKQRKGV